MLIELCPVCDQKLKKVKNSSGYYYCVKCSKTWTLEELEFEPVQKNLGDWLK